MGELVGNGMFPISNQHILALQSSSEGQSGMNLSQALQLGDGDRMISNGQRIQEMGDIGQNRVSNEGENVADLEEHESKHWSREATEVLIDAWSSQQGEGHKNLSQNHWQAVADAVNSRRAGKPKKNLSQCKHRIDTLKKVYKRLRKARTRFTANDSLPWPYYDMMDYALNIRAGFREGNDVSIDNKGQSEENDLRGSVPETSAPLPQPQDPVFAAQRVQDPFKLKKRARTEEKEPAATDIATGIANLAEVYRRTEQIKLDVMTRLEQNRTEVMIRLEELRLKAFHDLEQFKIQSRMEMEMRREEILLKSQLDREKFEEGKKVGKEQIEERLALEKEQLEVRRMEIQLELEKMKRPAAEPAGQ